MTGRRIGAAVFGAVVGGWIGRALFRWILDVDGSLQLVLILGAALAGAVVCLLGEGGTRRGGAPTP
jgi:hypothetical protein